jgi:gas vesicle structural protein
MVAEGTAHSVADDVLTDPVLRRGPYVSGQLTPQSPTGAHVRRAPNSTGLYDVLDLILDKGIVIDAFVRVSLVGIELVTVDLRVVIASVDTYLRYAEGAERLQLYKPRGGEEQLPDMMGMDKESGGVGGMMMKQGTKKLKKSLTGDKDSGQEGVAGRLAEGVRHVLTRGVGGVMERLSGEERDDPEERPRRRGDDDNGKHERDRRGKRDRIGSRR